MSLASLWSAQLSEGQAFLPLLSFQNPLPSLLRLSPLSERTHLVEVNCMVARVGSWDVNCFSSLLRTKALVLELLAAVCLVRGGHEIILAAFDNFKEVSLLHLCVCVRARVCSVRRWGAS